jgi:hypothetical protein
VCLAVYSDNPSRNRPEMPLETILPEGLLPTIATKWIKHRKRLSFTRKPAAEWQPSPRDHPLAPDAGNNGPRICRYTRSNELGKGYRIR